jgi:alpha-tubulin suppressor-like RCC1 family protein
MRARMFLAAALTALAGTACTDGTAPVPPSFQVSAESAVVHVDSTMQITATFTGADSLVAWFSFDTSVARVAGGTILGVGLGQTDIVAAADTFSARIPVRVVARLDQVAAGALVTCARTAAGQMVCWGINVPGSMPTVMRAPVRFVSVVAGFDHACGLATNGEAWCWGYGPLGDGTDSTRTSLVRVQSTEAFQQLTAGNQFSCGLTTTGQARCWGTNYYGVFGALYTSLLPMPVAPGLQFTQLSAGSYHVCGITAAGATWCWGQNYYGQTTDTSRGPCYRPCSVVPVQVANAPPLQSIASRDWHSCGVTPAGDAWCWGDNWEGQLGDSAGTGCFYTLVFPMGNAGKCSNTALPVGGHHHFRSLAPGNNHTCGVDDAGLAWCWGTNNTGQFGDASAAAGGPLPQPAGGGMSYTALSASGDVTCGHATDARVYCWGDDWWNALTITPVRRENRDVPVRIRSQP